MQSISDNITAGAYAALGERRGNLSAKQVADINLAVAGFCEDQLLTPTLERLVDPKYGATGDYDLSDEQSTALQSLLTGHIELAEVNQLENAAVVSALMGIAFVQDEVRANIEKIGDSNKPEVTRLLMLHNIYSLAALQIFSRHKVKNVPEDQRDRLQQLKENAEAYATSVQEDLNQARGATHEARQVVNGGALVFIDEEGATPAQRLGGRLRQARLYLNYTQAEVADGEYSVSYISAVERGQIRPSMQAMEYLSTRLHVPIAALLG